jgi:hypothetical protein
MQPLKIILICLTVMLTSCKTETKLQVAVYETSAAGAQLSVKTEFNPEVSASVIRILPFKP